MREPNYISPKIFNSTLIKWHNLEIVKDRLKDKFNYKEEYISNNFGKDTIIKILNFDGKKIAEMRYLYDKLEGAEEDYEIIYRENKDEERILAKYVNNMIKEILLEIKEENEKWEQDFQNLYKPNTNGREGQA